MVPRPPFEMLDKRMPKDHTEMLSAVRFSAAVEVL